MFISSKKSYEVCANGGKCVIPANYVGDIPDWAAKHWLVQAAIRDGSIATPEGRSDAAMESAVGEALPETKGKAAKK